MDIPQFIGRWRILAQQSQEEWHGILKAEDPLDGRSVAIKTVPFHLHRQPAAQTARIARLQHELRLHSRLSHPNIITLLAHGQQDNLPYLVFDWYPDTSLRELIRHAAPVPLPQALHLLRQTLAGLHYLHTQGWIHADIKPANLLPDAAGNLRIADFGSARSLTDTRQTAPLPITGTHGYMPPEQLMGQTLDPRADLFAVGVILHELLTGRKPFPGENAETITRQILTEPLSRPDPPLTPLPVPLADLLNQALAKRPSQRFPHAQAFLDALNNLETTLPA